MPLLNKIGSTHDMMMAKDKGRNLKAKVSANIVCLSFSLAAFFISTTAVCEVPKFTKMDANTEKDKAKK
mgnify:CR=1 FL=1|jgi:hypothetical protein